MGLSRTLRQSLFAMLCAATVFITACQTDAITGKSTLNLYSYDDEKRLGDEAVQPILAELGGLYPDPVIQDYVTMVGKKVEAAGRSRLRKDAGFPDWDFKFYVVNTSMLNAFALPGGHVFVTRGILLRMKDESELAGLLGHEVTHVFARHSVERMSEVTLMIIPVALLASIEETQGVAVVGMVAVQLLTLKYGRDDETEADHNGMRFAVRAGYHPDGIINVMRMLNEYTDEHGGGGPEFLSTHPDPGNRVDYLTRQMRKEYPDADTAAYLRNGPEYDAALVDIRACQPAYVLADQGDDAMGEGFKAFEQGGEAAALPHYRKALGLYQQAVNKVNRHAILHVNVAQAHYYLKNYEASERAIVEALNLEPGGFWPNFMGGLTAIKRNDHGVAAARFENALRLIPESPVGMFYLAVSYDRLGRAGDAVTYYRKAWDTFGGEGDLAEAARQRLIELGQPDPKTQGR